jgi:hypothetical protein
MRVFLSPYSWGLQQADVRFTQTLALSFFTSTLSQMKWYFNLMCFDLSWKTGFLASVMADLLLTLSITCYASPLLNSDINRASQIP